MVQLLAPYIDHEHHSAQRHRQTTDRQTDVMLMPIADHTVYSVAVRSAKNQQVLCFVKLRLKPEPETDCSSTIDTETLMNTSQCNYNVSSRPTR